MSIFSSQWWALRLADGWIAEQDEECVTICHPDGVGALQVSAYQKPDAITKEDLLDGADVDPDQLGEMAASQCGDFEGFYLANSVNDSFQRSWWLGSANTMLFVTYNCDLSYQAIEAAAVDSMVSSLRRRDA